MSGCVISRTPIAVDCWKRRNSQAKLFFLSHMHSDHTVGLNSSWNHTIYCSEITKALAIEKFNIAPSLMVAIPIGQSTILDLDEIGVEKLTVTLIDANHCPGAVMFLFQGYFGQVLCTGDFRYVDGMLDVVAPLKANPTINTLYLDNTYCKLNCEFPPKADAILMILNILQEHGDKKIVFGLDTLGKEDLLFKVAMVLEVPIVVDEYRLKTTKLLGYNVGFTTDPDASHIRVVPRNQVNHFTVSVWNKEHPTIAILPTCRFVGSSNPYAMHENIIVVPYSDHSSFSELKQFVAVLKPQQIIPVVQRPSDSREDMSIFNEEKSPDTTPHVFEIPASVVIFMSSGWNVGMVPSHGKKRKPLSFFNSRSKRPCGVVFPSHNNRPSMTKIGEYGATTSDRVQTDNPNEPAKKVQEQCHGAQNDHDTTEETVPPKKRYCEKEEMHSCHDEAENNSHAMETGDAENEAGGVDAAVPDPVKPCAMETNGVCEGHNATEGTVFTETCNLNKVSLDKREQTFAPERHEDQICVENQSNAIRTEDHQENELLNERHEMESVGEVEGEQQEQTKDDDGDDKDVLHGGLNGTLFREMRNSRTFKLVVQLQRCHRKSKQAVDLKMQNFHRELVSKLPFDPDESFKEGFCECEDTCTTVPENLEEMNIPEVQVKIEPEEDHIMETNLARREYGVAREAVVEKACLYEEKYTCAFEKDRVQEPSEKSKGNGTNTQCGLAKEEFDTSFCYPKNVFLYEGKWGNAFQNDKDEDLIEKGDDHDEAGNNSHAMETDNAQNEASGVEAAKLGPVKLCAVETNSVCEGHEEDQELSKKGEGSSIESQHCVAEVAANLCHSENVFRYGEKHTDVLENNRKEMQNGLTEMLSEQPGSILSAETNDACDTTTPKEQDNLKMTLEEDYSPTRYCIRQRKRRHSNIYGGSCMFAWNILQKLKAKQHSK